MHDLTSRPHRLALVATLAISVPLLAEVRVHGLFRDNMVLQQGRALPVWGTAKDGEQVTAHLAGQAKTTIARDGRWMVKLDALSAGGPHLMAVQGRNTVRLKNVLVGEVWVCSGESNMAMSVKDCEDAEAEIARSGNTMIRLFTVRRKVAEAPETKVKGEWQVCGPDTVAAFSAAGYFFGRDLQKARNVPVGLINISVEGSTAEAWTSKSALEGDSVLEGVFEDFAKACETYPKEAKKHRRAMSKWRKAAERAEKGGELPPPPPKPPVGPGHPHQPAGLYNGMVASLMPYAIAGVTWCQGESNVRRAYRYRCLFPAMVRCWRRGWGQGNFPFLFVQLAAYSWQGQAQSEPSDSEWAELREAQTLALRLPATGMVVATDLGDPSSIHPKRKQQVGARLALTARALAYREPVIYSGPMYESLQIVGDKALVTFKHVGTGLITRGEGLNLPPTTDQPTGEEEADPVAARLREALTSRAAEDGRSTLKGFTIAGDDRKFVWAHAELLGNTVMVSSPKVPVATAVRYAWEDYPICNLVNYEGLPAVPFRTDDFAMVTAPRTEE